MDGLAPSSLYRTFTVAGGGAGAERRGPKISSRALVEEDAGGPGVGWRVQDVGCWDEGLCEGVRVFSVYLFVCFSLFWGRVICRDAGGGEICKDTRRGNRVGRRR